MVVKTYKGLLAHGAHDRIRLSTIKGKVGYRIIKFAIIAIDPNESVENVVKIYMTEQTTIDTDVNFSDANLLACAMWWSSTGQDNVHDTVVIFDREIVNQDIYVTNADNNGAAAMNYYIELEVIPLTDQAAEYTTLKDIRTQLTIS